MTREESVSTCSLQWSGCICTPAGQPALASIPQLKLSRGDSSDREEEVADILKGKQIANLLPAYYLGLASVVARGPWLSCQRPLYCEMVHILHLLDRRHRHCGLRNRT
jgi:hypothetical protein